MKYNKSKDHEVNGNVHKEHRSLKKMNSKTKHHRKPREITVVIQESPVNNNANGASRARPCVSAYYETPIPNRDDLNKRFSQIMASIDLTEEKRQVLEDYSDEKKWQLVCDTNKISAKEQPEYYISALKSHLLESSSKSKSGKLNQSWPQTFSDLEISLRTNSIEWVREFLNKENSGLNVIVDLLHQALQALREREIDLSLSSSSTNTLNNTIFSKASSLFNRQPAEKIRNQYILQTAPGDVHLGVKCLKAIMNHKYGFSQVFAHEKAIDSIVMSLLHDNLRTRTLALDLLSVLCLVKGGHSRVLQGFENCKKVCGEEKRFGHLVQLFISEKNFDIDFSTACMRCINLLVHSPEDMNYRVYLQHEFKLMGLEKHLLSLKNMGSDQLQNQINAYFSNNFDVSALMSDAKHVGDMKKQVAEADMVKAKLEEIENCALGKISSFETELLSVMKERDLLKNELTKLKEANHEKLHLTNGLPPSEEEDEHSMISIPNSALKPNPMMAAMKKLSNSSSSSNQSQSIMLPPSPFTDAHLPPGNVPPPPPPGNIPPPPPPPPLPPPSPALNTLKLVGGIVATLNSNGANEQKNNSIKSVTKSRHRLPALNWTPLTQGQIKGTIYADINEEGIYKIMNLEEFEDKFKLHNRSIAPLPPPSSSSTLPPNHTMNNRTSRKVDLATAGHSLLNPNRQRHIAIARKKLNLDAKTIAHAIDNFDLKKLPPEKIDLVERLMPSLEETQAYSMFESSGKSCDTLTEDDQLVIALLKIERVKQKLQVMSLLCSFDDTCQHLHPQIHAIKTASMSVKKSTLFKKLLEIILAVGNYMNSQNRGGAYGFKLQNLELLCDTKSNDKKQTLLHFIVKLCQDKFPEILNFYKEFDFIERAATTSIESITSDISELKKDVAAAEKEYDANWHQISKALIGKFLKDAKVKLEKLDVDCASSLSTFFETATYFGENAKTASPNVFFNILVKFIGFFKQAEHETEVMKQDDILRKSHFLNGDSKQADVLDELKQRVREKKVLSHDEVGFGTVDGMLEDLRSEPFVRVDAYYKSRRK